MTNQKQPLPSGEFKTVAILNESDGKDSNKATLFDRLAEGAGLRLNVLARDPSTGEYVALDLVPYRAADSVFGPGIVAGKKFSLTASSAQAFAEKDVSRMELRDIPQEPPFKNTAIPEQAIIKDQADSFRTNPSAACKKFSEKEKNLRKKMGLVHDRDDMVLLQGRQNGASPGLLIQQSDGNMQLFDKSGKQDMTLNGTGMSARTPSFDTGGASLNQDSILGIPSQRNPMADVLPSGTILTPFPALMPNIRKIASILLTITDLIDFVCACGEAVQYICGNDRGVEAYTTGNPKTSGAEAIAEENTSGGNNVDISKLKETINNSKDA